MQSALCAAQPKTALQKKRSYRYLYAETIRYSTQTKPKTSDKAWGPPQVSLSADERWLVWRRYCRRALFWFARSLRLCFCSYLPLHSKTWPRQQRNTYSFRWPYRGTLPATLQTSQLKLEKEKFPLSQGDQLCTWLCVAISNTVLTADYSQGVGPVGE